MKPYYKRGGITIYCGDSLEIAPALPKVDLIVTDPPYGIRHKSSHGASWQDTEIANDHSTHARDNMLEFFSGVPAVVFGTWKTARPRSTEAVLIWDKGPAFGMGNLKFPWKGSFEEIYVIGSKAFTGRRDEGVLKGHRVVSWESKGRVHPHQKPVSLLQHFIAKAPSAMRIMDPFAGSGSTLIAALNLGRECIGIEIDERYCEIAARRLEDATAKAA